MSSNIQVGTPILKGFIHNTGSLSIEDGWTKIIEAVNPQTGGSSKRAICMIQNADSAASITVAFTAANSVEGTPSSGIILLPYQSISLDNYNGEVWVLSSSESAASINTAEAFA